MHPLARAGKDCAHVAEQRGMSCKVMRPKAWVKETLPGGGGVNVQVQVMRPEAWIKAWNLPPDGKHS